MPEQSQCPNKAHVVWTDVCDSTNSVLRDDTALPHGYVLAARRQTAGRGQRGNAWESQPDANLTFSLLLHPRTAPSRQFELSMVISLAVADFLRRHMPGTRVMVKWPNDIYIAPAGKIAGILIEHILSGNSIHASIVGIGLNVNQTHFRSDAPNPVSMASATGQTYPLDDLMDDLARTLVSAVDEYEAAPDPVALTQRYNRLLFRHDAAMHPFRDMASDTDFMARILGVAADGTLTLETDTGQHRNYLFKEVKHILTCGEQQLAL